MRANSAIGLSNLAAEAKKRSGRLLGVRRLVAALVPLQERSNADLFQHREQSGDKSPHSKEAH